MKITPEKMREITENLLVKYGGSLFQSAYQYKLIEKDPVGVFAIPESRNGPFSNVVQILGADNGLTSGNQTMLVVGDMETILNAFQSVNNAKFKVLDLKNAINNIKLGDLCIPIIVIGINWIFPTGATIDMEKNKNTIPFKRQKNKLYFPETKQAFSTN